MSLNINEYDLWINNAICWTCFKLDLDIPLWPLATKEYLREEITKKDSAAGQLLGELIQEAVRGNSDQVQSCAEKLKTHFNLRTK